MKFSIKDFFTFTEEILNGKFHFLCSGECLPIHVSLFIRNPKLLDICLAFRMFCWQAWFKQSRSSRLEVFCKEAVLRNFAKFTGKHLYQSLVFNKVAGLRPATLLQKRLWHRCFPVNFAKFVRTAFFTEQP